PSCRAAQCGATNRPPSRRSLAQLPHSRAQATALGVHVMALTQKQMDEQRKQAEELLFSGPQTLGFAKALFFGHFQAPLVFPYPEVKPEERAAVEQAVAEVRRFADERIDAPAIDRNADIPPDVIGGLAQLGVLGMTAPAEYGGRGFSQLGYTKVME